MDPDTQGIMRWFWEHLSPQELRHYLNQFRIRLPGFRPGAAAIPVPLMRSSLKEFARNKPAEALAGLREDLKELIERFNDVEPDKVVDVFKETCREASPVKVALALGLAGGEKWPDEFKACLQFAQEEGTNEKDTAQQPVSEPTPSTAPPAGDGSSIVSTKADTPVLSNAKKLVKSQEKRLQRLEETLNELQKKLSSSIAGLSQRMDDLAEKLKEQSTQITDLEARIASLQQEWEKHTAPAASPSTPPEPEGVILVLTEGEVNAPQRWSNFRVVTITSEQGWNEALATLTDIRGAILMVNHCSAHFHNTVALEALKRELPIVECYSPSKIIEALYTLGGRR